MLGRKDVMHTSGNTINLGNVSDFIDSKWDFESHVIVKSNSSVIGGNDERISSHNTTKAPGRASAFVLGAVDFADEGRITLIDAILSMSESPNVTNHTDHANTIASKVSGLTTKENVQPVADNLVVMNTTGDDNLNGKFRKLLSPQQYKVSTEAANFNMKNLPTTGNQISNPIPPLPH
ncbi:hypothetical protein DPMN_132400 [Dreissena polymorpha]|uniref:Uncharacterized protein n=1 Tax=Dreissena polymorpha TaxID=45954 RepID=A0A9D4FVV0_DREPO|nr:hypothetical protein DPMN_132400 [Dreissena polymorpha]